MLGLEDIRKKRDLVDDIDWDMTPEEAITLYLEWGNNWSHGRMVKSRDDVSYYFVIDTWQDPPVVRFIRRNSDGADELAHIHMPENVRERFLESVRHNKGVWGLTGEVRDWLEKELNSPAEKFH